MERRLIDIRELSVYLKIPVNTLYAWVEQGKIRPVKCGRLLRFDLQYTDKWIEEKTVKRKRFEHIRDKLRY